MDVDIDDRHACEALREHGGRRDGDVVEQAEAHRPVALGVMARRADEGDNRLVRVQRMVRSLHGCTSGNECDFDGLGRRERIGVERDGTATGRADCIEVLGRVHAEQFRTRGLSGLAHAGTEFPPSSRDRIEYVRAFGALGMAWRCRVLVKTGRGQQEHRSWTSLGQRKLDVFTTKKV